MKSRTHEQKLDFFEQLKAKLQPLGFEDGSDMFHWSHPDLVGEVFDMSASDPEKIALIIYRAGVQRGILEQQRSIMESLGMEVTQDIWDSEEWREEFQGI